MGSLIVEAKGRIGNFLHPSGVKITLSGGPGDDAKHYHERDLKRAIWKDQTVKKTSDRYVKVVAWDENDQCYIGRCPGLMFGGVHGDDETAVYRELCQAVDEWIQLHQAEGRPLPEPTSLQAIEALV
jgi:predicted RNase H-like HicB family nuclease